MWIENLKDGRYKFVETYIEPYTEKEKKVTLTLSKKTKQAQNEAQKILTQKINDKLKNYSKSSFTLPEVIEAWFDGKKKSLRPTSIATTQSTINMLNKYIQKDALISNVDTPFFQRLFDSMDYANETVSGMKSILNGSIRYAMTMHYIDDNPLTNVKINWRAKTIEDLASIESKYLEQDELKAVLKQLSMQPYSRRAGLLVEFLSLTGMRIGEAVSLYPENIDFENEKIHIEGTINVINGKYSEATKGPVKTPTSFRTISVTSRTLEIIKQFQKENELLKLSDDYKDKNFIFTTRYGNPMNHTTIDMTLIRTAKKLGLNKKISVHIFRHTHISYLAELGVPQKAIMDRVGHIDAKITRTIYSHVTKEMETDLIKKLKEAEEKDK